MASEHCILRIWCKLACGEIIEMQCQLGLSKHCSAVAYSSEFSVSSVVKSKPVRSCFLNFENCFN